MKIEYPSEKIEKFSRNCLENSPIGFDEHAEKVAYRRFHRLLIVNHIVESKATDRPASYCKEATADSSLAFLLFFLNLNKASLASLRSSIENAWRYLIECSGQDASKIQSVPDLVSEARALSRFAGYSTEVINRGYELYKNLCQAVHSSKEDYLSNEVPFQNLTNFDKKKSSLNLGVADKVFQHNLEVIVLSDFQMVKNLDSDRFDTVMDGLPRTLKRLLHAASDAE